MHFQIKHLLRPNLRVAVTRTETPRRTVCAAPQRGVGPAGPRASAGAVTLRTRRGYARDAAAYGRAFASARDQPETFWGEAARDVDWFEPWRRALHAQDPVFPDCDHCVPRCPCRLRSLFLAGERCDVETLEWAKSSFGVPVLDHWWQTETGSAITSSCIGLGNSLTPPAGQAGKPVPGYDVKVVDDDMREVRPRTLGNIVVRPPLPPGAALSLWQNPDLYKELYFTKFPGYYDTMDAGFVDEEGFLYIMSRSDDVINVAGHRLSAGALEESVLQHPAIGDCAVVGLEDALKGVVPLALCVLKNGVQKTEQDITKEVVKLVRDTVGPVAAFRKVLFVRALPKTRSGKIPRSALANLVNGKPYKITPTIEDPEVFKDIERHAEKALRNRGD
ncbi:LOW QUALITY PROTEIN: acyl-CoA synthetase short-chain family member 3, mitochondrial [Pungitius pungitius]|uniref:LOW QUALITY PROTEIN: acyl-CoA synthetase short-chain family member 3, mitochondrial n=1 Tax=Pungitius pungitius TaxID=134920 RepID=UPI002E10D576